MQPHQKHTPLEPVKRFLSSKTCASGGAGGIRTPVQNTFLVASYNRNIIYYNTITKSCQVFLW